MRWTITCAILALVSAAFSQVPPPDGAPVPIPIVDIEAAIHFPKFDVTPAIDPKPSDPVPINPDYVPVLKPDQFYVVESDIQFELVAFPEKSTIIAPQSGPVTLFGKFIDGPDEIEVRTYTKKWVAVARLEKGFTGRMYFAAIPYNFKSKGEFLRATIDAGKAPQPPPKPDDPVVPDVPVDPIPSADTFKTAIQTVTKATTPTVSERGAVAKAFRDVAALVNSGTITTKADLVKQTSDMIVQSIGNNEYVLGWVTWRDSITKIVASEKLASFKDHAKLWITIADVLDNK